MLVSAGVVLLTVGVGLPAAWRLTPGERPDPTQVVGIAATIGLMVNLLAGLALVRAGIYGQVSLVGVVLVFVAGSAVAVVRAGGRRPGFGAIDRWSWAGLAPALVTFAIPKQPAYFVFQTGDMGDYVNSANIAADIGRLSGGFPHGFSIALANVHLIFGEGAIDSLTPALGALLVLGLVAAARSLGVPLVPAVAVGMLAAVNPVTVWFSVFPVSEMLYAVLLLGMVVLLASARRHDSMAAGRLLAVVAGGCGGVLLLVRGNAMLVLPVVVIVQLVSWVVDDPHQREIHAWFSFAAVASLGVAYGYDVRFLPQYFVENQLGGQLSQSTFDRLGSYQLLGPSLVLAVTLVLGVAFWGAMLWGVERWRASGSRGRLPAQIVLGATAVVTAVYVAGAGPDGTIDGMRRWGIALGALAVVGLVSLSVRPAATTDLVAWAVPVLVGFAGVALYAKRIPDVSNHAYFLYWDRYLVSEAFPVAWLLAVAGGTVIWSALRRWRESVQLSAMAAVIVVAAAPVLPTTSLVTQHRLLGDAYGALDAIADEVPPTAPIVFSGIEPPPEGWFFPNTFRALATPLTQTFDRRVLNLPSDAFAADPVPGPADIERLITSQGRTSGYLFVARPKRASPRDPDDLPASATLVERRGYRVWLLSKRIDTDDERFRSVDLVLDLYLIDLR